MIYGRINIGQHFAQKVSVVASFESGAWLEQPPVMSPLDPAVQAALSRAAKRASQRVSDGAHAGSPLDNEETQVMTPRLDTYKCTQYMYMRIAYYDI